MIYSVYEAGGCYCGAEAGLVIGNVSDESTGVDSACVCSLGSTGSSVGREYDYVGGSVCFTW